MELSYKRGQCKYIKNLLLLSTNYSRTVKICLLISEYCTGGLIQTKQEHLGGVEEGYEGPWCWQFESPQSHSREYRTCHIHSLSLTLCCSHLPTLILITYHSDALPSTTSTCPNGYESPGALLYKHAACCWRNLGMYVCTYLNVYRHRQIYMYST